MENEVAWQRRRAVSALQQHQSHGRLAALPPRFALNQGAVDQQLEGAIGGRH